MNTADEYWKYAHECTRWAVDVENEKDQKIFLDMAKAWTQVALAHRPPLAQSADEHVAQPRSFTM